MFKAIVYFTFFCLGTIAGFAQLTTNKPIAPFIITLSNGKVFKHTDLVKGKAAILIYFSPTCGHCKDFMKCLLAQKQKLANKQFILVTVDPLDDVKAFNDQYHLQKFINIKVGIESSPFIVKEYYKVQHFPFIASYHANGTLRKIIDKEMKPVEMVTQVLNE